MACLRHQAWQEHTHFIGFIKETRGGTSRIWDIVGMCVLVFALACMRVCASEHLRLCVRLAVLFACVGSERRCAGFQRLCGGI